MREHAAIVEGLAAGDAEGSVAALVRHLRNSQERRRRAAGAVLPSPALRGA